jgi:acetyl esterase/lipase
MFRFKAAILAAIAVVFSACSPFTAVNLLVPRYGYVIHAGIAFGSDPRQKLDIYTPNGLKVPAPVLVFFYGGSWESGRRGDYLAFGQAFASQGIVTVIADYRLYPRVKYPAFIEDGARALAYVHTHIGSYGGDAGLVYVCGHSAGAYNAATLGSDPKYLKMVGGDFSWIKGVIGIAGPYDFLPLTGSDLIDIFHGANNAEAMPINHVDGLRPPMLLVTGADDNTVSPGNSDRMAAKLKSFGNSVQVIHYPGVGHIGIILSLVPGFRGKTTLREDILTFVHSH